MKELFAEEIPELRRLKRAPKNSAAPEPRRVYTMQLHSWRHEIWRFTSLRLPGNKPKNAKSLRIARSVESAD